MPTNDGPRGLYLPDGSFRPFDAEALNKDVLCAHSNDGALAL
jgi:hypothetical protein